MSEAALSHSSPIPRRRRRLAALGISKGLVVIAQPNPHHYPERCGVTLAWRALVVPQYRCFCLTEEDRVAWGLHLEAKTLEAAIEAAHRACQEHLHASSSRVEIWRGANKLHVSSRTGV